ncbi:MAG: hypothetical protein HY917_03325 [Candidatus Diapherotrites archaeon]|nr:hypothetical protein [Candidatus Diapherotrites archaeon]
MAEPFQRALNRLPGKNYSLILSSIVFMEMKSIKEMVKSLNGMKRALNPENGKIILLTTTPEAYRHNWINYHGAHPGNQEKKAGNG